MPNLNNKHFTSKEDLVENLGSLMFRKKHGLLKEQRPAKTKINDIKKEVARYGNSLNNKNSLDESQFKTDDKIFNLY